MEKLPLKLHDVLKEEGVSINDLPADLKKRINTLNSAISRYNEKATESLANSIVTEDSVLCNAVYDYLDEVESDNEAKKTEEEAKKAEEEKAKQQQEKKYAFGTKEMADAIKSTAKDGVISESQIRAIIGKMPDYPIQEVYNIKIKKMYLRPEYKIQD